MSNFFSILEALLSNQGDALQIDAGNGKLVIRMGPQDKCGAQILKFVLEELASKLTVGECEDALISALWWLQYFAATESAPSPLAKPEEYFTKEQLRKWAYEEGLVDPGL